MASKSDKSQGIESEVDEGALDTKRAEAQAALTTAQDAFKAAASSGDMKAMLEASQGLQTAQRNLERAEREMATILYERDAQARTDSAVALKAAIESTLPDFKAAYGFGIRGWSVTINEDGTVNVNITANKPISPKAARTAKTGDGASKSRNLWVKDGQTYTSRELLEVFGGAEGALAIDKARNFKNYTNANGEPLKFSPGFDPQVKKLAREIGAVQQTA